MMVVTRKRLSWLKILWVQGARGPENPNTRSFYWMFLRSIKEVCLPFLDLHLRSFYWMFLRSINEICLPFLDLHLCSFYWMFLRSIKEIRLSFLDTPLFFYWLFLRSVKEINRLISKGISNIYF